MIDAKIVSPDRALFEGQVTEVYARSVDGEIGILTGHQPALLLLAPGPLEFITADGTRKTFVVRSGFLEYSEGQLTVLAEDAEEMADKDAAQARVQEYADQQAAAQPPG